MFRNLLTLGALAAAALAATSCRQNHSDPQPIEAVVPLAVGNQWVYQVSRYDASGAPTDTVRLVRSVVKDTVINNSTWYILSNRTVVQNNARGYARYDAGSKDGLTIYQSSATGGIGYGYDLPTYKLLVYTVPDSRLQSVVTPKGMFSSHQYTIENQYTYPGNAAVQIVKRLEYVAPGVGLVKSDQYYRDSPVLQQRQVLIDYTLK